MLICQTATAKQEIMGERSMKLVIDTDQSLLIKENNNDKQVLELYSRESFELISEQWVRVGWNEKYSYTFTWLGVPIIQIPEDMLRIQEIIYQVKPDVIIETGIAHGGSLIFYSSLCKAIGKGRVIGIDIEIRLSNREGIENHDLSPLITLVEGDSTNESIIEQVKSIVRGERPVMVILDSAHSKAHVLKELEAYSDLVSVGSYIVVTDGIMRELHDVPRGEEPWEWDNPLEAAAEFVARNSDFVFEQPRWPFNESNLEKDVDRKSVV